MGSRSLFASLSSLFGRGRRVKTPTILQMESAESGAAALAIVLGYYKKFIPLEQLRVDCGVSRDGSKAENIVRAAANYGLEASLAQKDMGEVRDIPLPAIVQWNFSQFVVLEGMTPRNVSLNDPQSGPRSVTPEEFDQGFTGVVLTFKPGAQFVPGPPRTSFLTSLRKLLAGSESALVFLLVVVLGLVLPGIVVPVFAKIFVDEVLVGNMHDWVGPLLVAMAATAAVRAALTWLQQRYILRLGTKLAVAGSSRFVWHVLRLPMEFFGQRTPGDLTSRVEANDRVATLLSGDLATAAFNMINVVFFGAIMLTYHRTLSLIAFGTAVLNVAILKYLSRLRRDGNQRLMQEQAKLMGVSMAGLQIIETLKATGGENDFFAYWAGSQAKSVTAQQHLSTYTLILVVVPKFLFVLSTGLVIWVGAQEVMDGIISIGTLVAFLTLMASFLDPISDFVAIGTRVQDADADINRINDVMRYQTDPYAPREVEVMASEPSAAAKALITSIQPPLTADLSSNRRRDAVGAPGAPAGRPYDEGEEGKSKLAGFLEMRNVTFGYSRLSEPLLSAFSLQLKPGSRVALVGASGSGKSTIARLATGLYRPWSGEVLLDGVALAELPRWLVHSSVAAVDQDILLFEGSIADNLTMWDHTIDRPRIITAAKDACVHDIIASRPGAYDAWVEESGTNFSGGQRQRLEIARALVIEPSLLILDEATSALDVMTETLIDQSVRGRGCTTLIIAHRLSTIRDSDEIIVLEQGKVVQRGTHEELINVDAPYRRLILAA